MANEEKKTDKKVTKSNKVVAFIKNLGVRIATSCKNTYHELKKVTWPTKPAMVNYTLLVVGFIVVMGIVIFAIDSGAGALVKLITK